MDPFQQNGQACIGESDATLCMAVLTSKPQHDLLVGEPASAWGFFVHLVEFLILLKHHEAAGCKLTKHCSGPLLCGGKGQQQRLLLYACNIVFLSHLF